MSEKRPLLLSAMLVLLAVTFLGGCGYLKNVRDDFRDCIILSAGVTPPVATAKGETVVGGIIPPSFGVYFEATDFIHLGAIRKVSADVAWDRRGQGILVDDRTKVGFLPLRYVAINETPLKVNAYKEEGNELDAWRTYMRSAKDYMLREPAKELIYRDFKTGWSFKKLQRGWQGWEVFQVELAIPEPFVLHSGVNVRAGFDISECFDFVVGLVGVDLYGDAAYAFGGKTRSLPIVRDISPDETPPSDTPYSSPYGAHY